MSSNISNLFTPIVPQERMHPNFQRICESGTDAERDVLLRWAEGFVDRDGKNKFTKEFQTTFNSSFWELYLHAFLRDVGCELDMSFERPDFVVCSGPFGEFVAEAAVASNPQSYRRECDFQGASPAYESEREIVLDLAAQRLANAFVSKHQKLKNGYRALKQCQGKPFVLCLAPFEQPNGHVQGTEAIDRVLFGGPRPLYLAESGPGSDIQIGFGSDSVVHKRNSSRVELAMFTRDEYQNISAVLFSSLATWSKVRALATAVPERHVSFNAVHLNQSGELESSTTKAPGYSEALEDGLHLFVNPYASEPIDVDPWLQAGVAVHEYCESGTITQFERERLLVMRNSYVVSFTDKPECAPSSSGDTPHYTNHVVGLPQDGEWFGGPANIGLTQDAWLFLYRGWTVAVSQDVCDRDWGYVAKCGQFQNMKAFISAKVEQEMFDVSFATRDDAKKAAIKAIESALSSV